MVCPNCKAANPDSLRFCGQCGRSLQTVDDAQTLVIDGPAATQPQPVNQPMTTTGLVTPPPDANATIVMPPSSPDAAATIVLPNSIPGSSLSFGAPQAGAVMPTNLPPGTQFGARYRIEKLLGEGGMGAVYKAYDTELGRTVALKLVRPELATSPQTMQRFKQELLLASKISHKNILRIHDLGDVGGVKFITMAFVEGCDLSNLLDKDGRLPFDRAMKYTRQLCGALEAAHNEGVVHRDLKPQNILIDATDNVYVSDFGLAKSLENEATMMTRTGQILGTPRYMSPEQVEAVDVDHRADIYSLGLIIYEMFTGDIPFRGESAMQLMYQRVNEPPKDPRTICPDMPDYLATIILKCLERKPADRYQNTREILNDLDAHNAPMLSSMTLTAVGGASTIQTAAPKVGGATISIQIPKPSKKGTFIGVAVAVLIALILALPVTRHMIFGSGKPGVAKPLYKVAVLPPNVSDESMQYIGAGLVDALSAKLSGLQKVYVASPDIVSTLAGRNKGTNDQLAKSLGVNYLVQVVLTSSGDNIEITAKMDEYGTKAPAAPLSVVFDGNKKDLLPLENQIFNKLVERLTIKQTTAELEKTKNPTVVAEAYDFYLQGRNVLRGKRDKDSLTKALDLFDNATKLDPGFALAMTGYADACVTMYDLTQDKTWLDKAYNTAQLAYSKSPNLPEVHLSLGSIYTAQGLSSQAMAELMNAKRLAPNSDEGPRRLGRAYLKAGDKEHAIENLVEATEINDKFWNNFAQLGNAYFTFGENQKALEACLEVTRLAPELPAGWSNLGAAYYRLDKFTDAISAFQKAINIQPTKADYYSQLGTAYFFAGQYAQSIPQFQKAVEYSPNSAFFQTNLGDALYWGGQRDKANAAYDKAIKLALEKLAVNATDSESMGVLASCYAKKNDSTNAQNRIHEARQLDPKSNDLMYREAVIDAEAKRFPEAIASLRSALQNGYNLSEAKADPELAELRKTPECAKLLNEIAAKPAK